MWDTILNRRETMDINKYLGVWYQLAHYPSWFDRADNYNTTAEYRLIGENTISVHNRSIVAGEVVESMGTGRFLGEASFRVDFPMPEVENVNSKYGYPSQSNQQTPSSEPNYQIVKLWACSCGDYVFSLVTDPKRESMYLLSRNPKPDLELFGEITKYITANFDRERVVFTPHY